MNIKILRCKSDTNKGIALSEDGKRKAEKWRCKLGQYYIAPETMPKSGTVILLYAEYDLIRKKLKVPESKQIVEMPVEIVRKCFETMENGGWSDG